MTLAFPSATSGAPELRAVAPLRRARALRSRTRAFPVFVAAFLLAGCLGTETPAASPASVTSTLSAAEDTSNETAEQTRPLPVEETVAWDATVGPQAVLCLDVAQGVCAEYAPKGWFGLYELGPHNWTHATFTLTWTSPVPEQKMGVLVMECPSPCQDDRRRLSDMVGGTSPLSFDLPIAPKDSTENATYLLVVPIAMRDLSPAYARANPDQPFRLEGAIHGVREE